MNIQNVGFPYLASIGGLTATFWVQDGLLEPCLPGVFPRSTLDDGRLDLAKISVALALHDFHGWECTQSLSRPHVDLCSKQPNLFVGAYVLKWFESFVTIGKNPRLDAFGLNWESAKKSQFSMIGGIVSKRLSGGCNEFVSILGGNNLCPSTGVVWW